MSGITTGVGLFSGIDTASLIDQLIAAQSRPQIIAQQRVIQLKSQQAAYLDINSRLSAFKTAAASFRVGNIFDVKSVSSSNESILTATGTTSAVPGSYNFIVDRLVSTQQMLTRGFPDLDSSTVGLDSLTFEPTEARLDADTALADLNDGNGITRGIITVNGTEVDLSTAGTVQEVLDAISSVPGVTARVENDHFVIDSTSSFTISETAGAGILSSLGLDPNAASSTTHTGTSVHSMNQNTSIQALNDGRGISFRRNTSGLDVYDMIITIDVNGDGSVMEEVGVRIGEVEDFLYDDDGAPILDDEGVHTQGIVDGAVSSVGGILTRINEALANNVPPFAEITASINTTTGGIDITDSSGRSFDVTDEGNNNTTATDLQIAGSSTGGAIAGTRIFAGMNTKLVSSLNGGTGLDGTSGLLNITTQDGTIFSTIDLSNANDINDIINTINAAQPGKLTASINSNGTGIQIVDNTTGGGTFSIAGTNGSDTAEALGISGSFTSGETTGSNLQLAYIGESSLVSELNNGQGIGTGKFEIIDSEGNIAEINITSNHATVGDIISQINGADVDVTARINDTGDGIIIEKDGAATGTLPITITNTTGTVASKLGIAGTAVDDANNFIDGSFETVVEFDPDATLEDIRNAINSANVGVSASVINTGIGTSPFRLNLTSEQTGESGRFLIDSGGFDMGFDILDEGQNSRVFFGSTDPATAVLMSSSTNQLDGVIQGVTIDLLASSDEAVEISVTTNNDEIETKVSDFVAAFNGVIDGIDFRTRYDEETETRGILLGDGTLLNLRNSMYTTINRENDGFTGAVDTLVEVGITIGTGGKLELDTTKFREAYAEDPQAVEDLFARQTLESNDDGNPNTIDEPSFSELSVLGQLEEFADSYVTSIGGVLQSRSDALDSQIKLQEDRIESIQKSLDNKRLILGRQFLAMEKAIGSFQSQGSSLSQIAALG